MGTRDAEIAIGMTQRARARASVVYGGLLIGAVAALHGSAAVAAPPPEALSRVCAQTERNPHCPQTTISFVAPTPPDGSVVTVPFVMDVDVQSNVPVLLVRYYFYEPDGAISSANRDTVTGSYSLVVDEFFSPIFERSASVRIQACAFDQGSNPDPATALACTERTYRTSS